VISAELINLLKRVILSWEVIAVTIAMVIFLFIVSYVARLNRPPKAPRPKKAPKVAKDAVAPAEDEAPTDED